MASLTDQTTGDIYALEPNAPFIIGRGKQKQLEDPHISRSQLEVNLLSDGRCFIKRLSATPSVLRGKVLPLNHEIQAYDGDIIEIVPNYFPFKVILADKTEGIHHLPVVGQRSRYYYDDFNADEYQTQQQASLLQVNVDKSEYATTSDEAQEEDSDSDGWMSTESSLLGGEKWDDIPEESSSNK